MCPRKNRHILYVSHVTTETDSEIHILKCFIQQLREYTCIERYQFSNAEAGVINNTFNNKISISLAG